MHFHFLIKLVGVFPGFSFKFLGSFVVGRFCPSSLLVYSVVGHYCPSSLLVYSVVGRYCPSRLLYWKHVFHNCVYSLTAGTLLSRS